MGTFLSRRMTYDIHYHLPIDIFSFDDQFSLSIFSVFLWSE